MELHHRLKNSSKDFSKCWRLIHKNTYSNKINQECLYWLKDLNKIMEQLEHSILGLERSLKGDEMPIDKRQELESHEAGEEMLRRWMPLIIYGEINNLNLQ